MVYYVYDVGGNIVSKTVYAYTLGEITEDMTPTQTTNFGYNYTECGDLLTDFTYTDNESSYNNVNTEIENDYMGNVLSFGNTQLEWTAGRQLKSVTEGTNVSKHYYNSDGFLTRVDLYRNGVLKEIDHYIWDGDVFVARTIEKVGKEALTSRIIYDTQGESIGFIAEAPDLLDYDLTFLYRKNLQGDITGILDEKGELWAEISYDAYGVPALHIPNEPDSTVTEAIQATIAFILTPQLYRGYVFAAVGNGMYTYYLGSRYYIPQFCRFLNADIHPDTETGVNGTNMFAYCNNNPVMNVDPTGESMESIINFILKFLNLIKILLPWTFEQDYKSYTDFLYELGKIESGNNYRKVNEYNYLGKYQFSTIALQDIGLKDSSKNWTAFAQNNFAISCDQDFLNSPEAQEYAIREYHKKTWHYIEYYRLDEYVNSYFDGVYVTQSGLLAACHLVGVASIRIMFETGEEQFDANNTSAKRYMQKLSGYDISELFVPDAVG